MRKYFVLALVSFLVFKSQAFQLDSTLTAILKAKALTLQFNGDNIEGDGAKFLFDEAEKAHFFLIGEGHGMAETPKLTASLLREIGPKGYSNFLTEVGPITAELITKKIAKESSVEAFGKEFKKHPWSIPFYAWKEEAEVLDVLKEQTGLGHQNIWGVDQEFIIAARPLLNRLLEMATTQEARKLVKDYYDKAITSFDKAVETKVPLVFFATARPADYDKLKKAFSGNEKAQRIINEMEETQEIYGKFNTGQGFQSNQQRADMMKRHFLEYYNASRVGGNTKVLGKLGANHMYKGYNSLGAMDIGNFIDNFAFSKSQQSFHLYAVGAKGTLNGYNLMSRSEDDKLTPVDNSDSENFASFIEAGKGNEMTVFDLRPLRALLFNRKLKGLSESLKKLIYGYDAVLVISEVSASTLYD